MSALWGWPDDWRPRFLRKIDGQPNGCWEWTGATNDAGYGMFRTNHRRHRAHRLAYELFIGEIPAGAHIDHLCRNPRCVHPLHMEPVTPRENVLRGTGVTAENARREFCKHGHALTGDNIYAAPGETARRCKECRRRCRRESASRTRAARAAA